MPFELYEKFDSYQQFMNDHFKNMINFVFCYIDDILMFFKIKKKHREHINKILHKFREIKLIIDIVKSVFYIQEMKFLNFIFTLNKFRMNLTKVEQIKNWLKSISDRDVFAIKKFIELVNFFRGFITDFGSIVFSLYNLLKKDFASV